MTNWDVHQDCIYGPRDYTKLQQAYRLKTNGDGRNRYPINLEGRYMTRRPSYIAWFMRGLFNMFSRSTK